MRSLRAILVISALLCASAGCGGGDGQEERPSDSPVVVYERGGGIAAMPEKLTVAEDGSLEVVVGADGASASGTLSDDELQDLRDLLDAAELEEVPGPIDPSACADCYVYSVAYDGLEVSYAEITEVPESVSAAVQELGRITEAHAPQVTDTVPE